MNTSQTFGNPKRLILAFSACLCNGLLAKKCAVKSAGLQRVQLPARHWLAPLPLLTALGDQRAKRDVACFQQLSSSS